MTFPSRALRFFLALFLLALAGCTGQGALTPTLAPTEAGLVLPTSPAETSLPAASPTPNAAAGVTLLRIWLPPQFNPDSGTPAGDLLKAQLEAFAALNPEIRLDVRLKALDGPGGLLDSLAAASAAAPLAVPDLIALPRPLLESAAIKGLLYPYPDAAVNGTEWYPYAQRLATLQGSLFGLPFAGDALLLAYRPSVLETPPADWQTVVSLGSVLAFPAADPNALYTLALYQSVGGKVQDDQGRPTLDEAALVQVLTFYQQASQAGVLPYWLTQYDVDDQAWTAFADGQAAMTVAWFSRFMQQSSGLEEPAGAAPLPTQDGTPFTLATGWLWALPNPDPAHRAAAARLAAFLTQDDFLSEWTLAAGYLPPSASVLERWPDASLRGLATRLNISAVLAPASEMNVSLGPALKEAVVHVLKLQVDPQTAAQQALERLGLP